MRGNLRLVSGISEPSAETLVEEALKPLPQGANAALIEERAQALARDVVYLIRREDEPAILASVVLVIPDQAMKVAFLEAIGASLL